MQDYPRPLEGFLYPCPLSVPGAGTSLDGEESDSLPRLFPGIHGTHLGSLSAMADPANILLVDDDRGLRGLVREILERRGYVVTEAWNYETAVRELDGGFFDLVLLDITLPGRNGLDILEFVRGRRPGCPVIMVTGTTGLDLAIRSMKLGAYDYITKPCTPNYLLKSIEHALAVRYS